jgi:hypothetical protein
MTRVTEVAHLSAINSDPVLCCLFHQFGVSMFDARGMENEGGKQAVAELL